MDDTTKQEDAPPAAPARPKLTLPDDNDTLVERLMAEVGGLGGLGRVGGQA